MLDLSFMGRGELSRNPIVVKDSDAIWQKTRDHATTVIAVILVSLMVYLVAR